MFKLLKKNKLKLKKNGKEIKQLIFNVKGNQKEADIQKNIHKLFEGMPKNKYSIKITTLYDNGDYKSAAFTTYKGTKDTIKMFVDYDDYDGGKVDYDSLYVKQIILYVVELPTKAGGTDDNNDCFYNCLIKAGLKIFIKPNEFKKQFKLKPNDLFPVSLINEVENNYYVNINITGDITYTSCNKYTKTINLELKNEHYTNKKNKSFELIKKMTMKEKKLIVYYREELTYSVYDGKDVLNIDYDNFIKIKKNIKYLTIKSKNKDIVKFYNEYMEQVELFKKHTKGNINLLRNKLKDEVLRLFYLKSKIHEPDEIEELEAKWLNYATQGGIMYGKKGNYNNVKSYDFNSMYPYLMTKKQYPIKKGEFKHINTLEEITVNNTIKYGIYRCNIIGENNLINTTKKYHTHSDLMIMKKLGLKIELIQDKQANALMYGSYQKTQTLFTEYIKEVIKYKEDNKEMKILLNILWGALSEKQTNFHKTNEDISVDDIGEIIFSSKEYDLIETYSNKKLFKTNYARIKPFVTSFGRELMINTIHKKIDNIYRINTDGFICSNDVNYDTGLEMGKLKLEWVNKDVKINNVNSIICNHCNNNIKKCVC
jgi:hypothetical protein